MSNDNNTRPGPGETWMVSIDGGKPQVVQTDMLDPVFYRLGIIEPLSIDDEGVKWLNPVPMPGEWAPMDLFNQLWTALSMTNPARGTVDYNILQRARAWDDPEVGI